MLFALPVMYKLHRRGQKHPGRSVTVPCALCTRLKWRSWVKFARYASTLASGVEKWIHYYFPDALLMLEMLFVWHAIVGYLHVQHCSTLVNIARETVEVGQ